MGNASWKGRVKQRPRFKGWRWGWPPWSFALEWGRMCYRTNYNGAVLAQWWEWESDDGDRQKGSARARGRVVEALAVDQAHVLEAAPQGRTTRDQEGDPKVKIEQFHQIVKEAIRSHSSPGIDRSDAHGCRGQAAYHVVDNHVGFIAHAIAKSIGEEQIKLVICRGCSLSGEVHVCVEGATCEVCDGSEPLTGEIVEDLARRIPRPPARTGSNPFFNLSQDYELPYDVVACYAERIREVVRNPEPSKKPPHSVWGEWALQRAIRIMNERHDRRFGEFHQRVVRLIDPDARNAAYVGN
jgi:hypothetical protein